MGDERLQLRDAAAETGRGRDPHADGPAPAAAAAPEVEVDDGRGEPEGSEAAADETTHGGGLGTGAAAPADASEAASSAPAQIGQGRGQLSLDDLEFHCVRALRYHEARAGFLDLWRRLLDFSVALAGAGAVTTLLAKHPHWSLGLNLLTAGIGALQLVANLGDRAQEHRWVHRRYAELYGRVMEVRQAGTLAPGVMEKLVKRWSAIWPDEGTTMHALEAMAYNAALRTLNEKVDPGDLIEVRFLRRAFRNVFTQEGLEAVTPNDRRRAADAAAESA